MQEDASVEQETEYPSSAEKKGGVRRKELFR